MNLIDFINSMTEVGVPADKILSAVKTYEEKRLELEKQRLEKNARALNYACRNSGVKLPPKMMLGK